jgi:hypothetical protein
MWDVVTSLLSSVIGNPKLAIFAGIVAAVAFIGKLFANYKHDKDEQSIGVRRAQDEAKAVQDKRVDAAQKAGDDVGANIAKDGLRADDGAKLE